MHGERTAVPVPPMILRLLRSEPTGVSVDNLPNERYAAQSGAKNEVSHTTIGMLDDMQQLEVFGLECQSNPFQCTWSPYAGRAHQGAIPTPSEWAGVALSDGGLAVLATPNPGMAQQDSCCGVYGAPAEQLLQNANYCMAGSNSGVELLDSYVGDKQRDEALVNWEHTADIVPNNLYTKVLANYSSESSCDEKTIGLLSHLTSPPFRATGHLAACYVAPDKHQLPSLPLVAAASMLHPNVGISPCAPAMTEVASQPGLHPAMASAAIPAKPIPVIAIPIPGGKAEPPSTCASPKVTPSPTTVPSTGTSPRETASPTIAPSTGTSPRETTSPTIMPSTGASPRLNPIAPVSNVLDPSPSEGEIVKARKWTNKLHGFPNVPRVPPSKKCMQCNAPNPTARKSCLGCQARFTVKQKKDAPCRRQLAGTCSDEELPLSADFSPSISSSAFSATFPPTFMPTSPQALVSPFTSNCSQPFPQLTTTNSGGNEPYHMTNTGVLTEAIPAAEDQVSIALSPAEASSSVGSSDDGSSCGISGDGDSGSVASAENTAAARLL